ncbi:18549_t:CDS:2 [Dentiscutata erythropus]|uniref:18549_t:CDS:1 n=1 Tax=Dentiscutata erythropus TaxID=1348616 RepID=A0A9N9DKD8_9GLOM|nr:18549_t:CDS:2 [Dentiscutata erythropus]
MPGTRFFEQQDGTKIAYQIFNSENAKIIVFDNRGIGESTVASYNDPLTVELMAQDTIALLKHLGIKRFNLFGTNMGARIAFETALKLPSDLKLEKIAVSSCAPKIDLNSGGSQKINKIHELSSTPFPNDIQGQKDRLLEGEFDQDLSKYLLEHPDDLDKMAEIIISRYDARPFEMMKRQWEANTTYELLPKLKEIKVPTLVIHAENDLFFSNKEAELLSKELSNSKLYNIPNMGNNIFVKDRETTANVISEFLNN